MFPMLAMRGRLTSHHFRTPSRRVWSPLAMPLTISFFFRFSRDMGSMVGTWRRLFPDALNENGSRRVPGLIRTEVSAFGGEWRWVAFGGRDHKECCGPLDREEDTELGEPIFGVLKFVDAPVVPEEKVREDEKLGRGGDKWSADPSSMETSEAAGVKVPNTLGRLKDHGPRDLGEEVAEGDDCEGLFCGSGGTSDPSLNVRPWRPMESERG